MTVRTQTVKHVQLLGIMFDSLEIVLLLDSVTQRYTIGILKDTHSLKDPTWLRTAAVFPCQYVEEDQDQHYIWRRLQTSQMQAERQKKNIIQLSLLFHHRAEKIYQALQSQKFDVC